MRPARARAGDDTERGRGYFGSLRYVGQHARTYLLCEGPDGALVVVDQHASHERLLFHRLSLARAARAIPVQPLLVPQIVTLPPGPARALEAAAPELAGIGLDVEPFGGDAFAVKALPALLAGVALPALLADLALQFEEAERGSAVDAAVHDLLATIACHARSAPTRTSRPRRLACCSMGSTRSTSRGVAPTADRWSSSSHSPTSSGALGVASDRPRRHRQGELAGVRTICRNVG